jgi:hypothetical protein
MAPEQISGSGQVDTRTDIYAAGVVLYEAVTGRVPFTGETLFDLMRMHLETAPQPPRALRPELPQGLENVIVQALAKDPAHRFQTAAAMAQATQHAAGELGPDDWRALSTQKVITGGRASTGHILPPKAATTVASPTPRHDAPPPPRARGPLPWILAMIATAAIAVVVTWQVVRRSPTKQPPAESAHAPEARDATAASVEVPPPAPVDAAVVVAAGGSAGAPPPKRAPARTPESAPLPVQPPPATQPKQITVQADYDPKRFDPVRYLPTALALARRLYPDAKLTRFDFEPVFSDGRVDLTMPGDDRSFWFRSEAASKRPAGVPPNVPVDRPCMIYVELEPGRVTARIVDNDECDDNLVRPPKCGLASVWKQALARGVPKDHVAKIGWLFDEKWFFDTDLTHDGTGETTSLPDRCP